MGFSVALLKEFAPDLDSGVIAVLGRIEIGEFSESFVTSLMYWSVCDYLRQWREGLERLIRGEKTSCLISSIVDPAVSSLLLWWPMCREGGIVHIQNQILLFDQLAVPFNEEDPYYSVGERRTVTEAGQPISEWNVEQVDIEAFLSRGSLPKK
jgi:hypothetical protein